MRTVDEILQGLLTFAPLNRKETWDNVGLACGRGNRAVDTVLVALDPTLPVLLEAQRRGAQLVVTHHPMTIEAYSQLNDGSLYGMTAIFAVEQGISVVNLHTNLDCADGGVNDCLASALSLQETSILPEPGKDFGYLRIGTVPRQPLSAFLPFVRERLHCPGLRYADGGKAVSRVAVGGGACGAMLQQAVQAGCDTFVTADLKYNHFLDASLLGLNLIDAGHFETEYVVCPALCRKLQALYPDLTVILDESRRGPIHFL